MLKSSRNFSILTVLFLIYLAFASNANLWNFFNAKIQLSEIVFLLILPFSIPLLKDIQLTRLDYLLTGYVFLFLVNLIFHQERGVFIEVIGILYFFVFYFLFTRFLVKLDNPDDFLKKGVIGLTIVACGGAFLGYFLYILGFSSAYIWQFKDYPYFGDVLRWTGFSSSPNMLISNLALAIFLLQVINIPNRFKLGLTLIALFVIFMTLSKGIFVVLSLLILLFFILRYFKDMPKWIILNYSFLVAVSIVCLTFFVFINKKGTNLNHKNTKIVAKEAMFETEYLAIHPTCYFYMFQSAKEQIKRHPWIGIGAGNAQYRLKEMKIDGVYPDYMPSFEAHDFYWGQAAELGVGYFVFLFFLAAGFYSFIRNEQNIIPNEYHLFLTFAIIFILIESTFNGSKHFRHYWIFLAIINSFYLRHQTNSYLLDA